MTSSTDSLLLQASLSQLMGEFPDQCAKVERNGTGEEDVDDRKRKVEGFCFLFAEKDVKIAEELEKEFVVDEKFKPKVGEEFTDAMKVVLGRERSRLSSKKSRILTRAISYGYIHTTATQWTRKKGDNDIEKHHKQLKEEAFERYRRCAAVLNSIPVNESFFYQLPPMILLIMIVVTKFKKDQEESFFIKKKDIVEIIEAVFGWCDIRNETAEAKEILQLYVQFVTMYEDAYAEEILAKYYLLTRSMGDKILENEGVIPNGDSHTHNEGHDTHAVKYPKAKKDRPRKKQQRRRKGPPSITKRGPEANWAPILKKKLDSEDFKEIYSNSLLGTEFNVFNLKHCCDSSLPALILQVVNTMKFARERDTQGITQLADTSLDCMAGLFNSLKQVLGIRDNHDEDAVITGKWIDNNLIWKDDEEGTDVGDYIYRVPALESLVIGSLKGIEEIVACIDAEYSIYEEEHDTHIEMVKTNRDKAKEAKGTKFNAATFKDPIKEKTKEGWGEFVCHLFKDIASFVGISSPPAPSELRSSRFTRTVQEYHNNWAEQGKMDFLKDGNFSMGKRKKGKSSKKRKIGEVTPTSGAVTERTRKRRKRSSQPPEGENRDEDAGIANEGQRDLSDEVDDDETEKAETGDNEQDPNIAVIERLGQMGNDDDDKTEEESESHDDDEKGGTENNDHNSHDHDEVGKVDDAGRNRHDNRQEGTHQGNNGRLDEWKAQLEEWKTWKGPEEGESIKCGIDLRGDPDDKCHWKGRFIMEKHGLKCYNCGTRIHKACAIGSNFEEPHVCSLKCKEDFGAKMKSHTDVSSKGLEMRKGEKAAKADAKKTTGEAGNKRDNHDDKLAGNENDSHEKKAGVKGVQSIENWDVWLAPEDTRCGLYDKDARENRCVLRIEMIPEGSGHACNKCGLKMHHACCFGAQLRDYEDRPPYFCSETCENAHAANASTEAQSVGGADDDKTE